MRRRGTSLSLAAVLLLLLLLPAVEVGAEQAEEELRSEANRLTGELIDLRARKEAAAGQRDELQAQLRELEVRIASAEEEAADLREELETRKQAYRESIRNMYKNGEVSELEVLLESEALEEMWENRDYLNRMASYHREVLDRLREALAESEIRERDLREYRAKRERLLESLNEEALDARIADLEARLDRIDAALRELSRRGEGAGGGSSPGSPASPLPPGTLRERVPEMPSLEDFRRTGTVFSGYTTSYGEEFHGRPTSSGVIYNMYDFTCAHRTLPFGTWLLVTYQGRQVIVQVNDRGPFVPGRVLDLSRRAAETLGLYGVQWTEFEIIVPKGG